MWGYIIDNQGNTTANFEYYYKTFAIDLLINYANREWVRLYTSLEPGISFITYKDKSTTTYNYGQTSVDHSSAFNMQYVPFGINIGKKFSGFLEIGIGFKGYINAGVSYKLAKKTLINSPK